MSIPEGLQSIRVPIYRSFFNSDFISPSDSNKY